MWRGNVLSIVLYWGCLQMHRCLVIDLWWKAGSMNMFTKEPTHRVKCHKHGERDCQKLVGEKGRTMEELLDVMAAWLYRGDADNLSLEDHRRCRPS